MTFITCLVRSQMCVGDCDYFSPSKPHSGTLCDVLMQITNSFSHQEEGWFPHSNEKCTNYFCSEDSSNIFVLKILKSPLRYKQFLCTRCPHCVRVSITQCAQVLHQAQNKIETAPTLYPKQFSWSN